MFKGIFMYSIVLGTILCAGGAFAEQAQYVGSKFCADCHEEQYNNFKKLSKKAHSWDSITIMKDDLKKEELKQCYECHTTGYGQKSGFVSYEKTPHLADVGCETCHGAGSIHADSGDPEDISRKPALKTCLRCHNEERVGVFGFKPLMYSGAH